jgi:hypothetical protein
VIAPDGRLAGSKPVISDFFEFQGKFAYAALQNGFGTFPSSGQCTDFRLTGNGRIQTSHRQEYQCQHEHGEKVVVHVQVRGHFRKD